jgi:hypothetical protein
MIRVRVGLEQPANREALSLRRFEHCVGTVVIDGSTDGIEAEHRVDHRPLAGGRVTYQVADAVGGFVEECLDRRRGADAVRHRWPAHDLVGGLPVGCVGRAGELSGTSCVHRRQFFMTAADIRIARELRHLAALLGTLAMVDVVFVTHGPSLTYKRQLAGLSRAHACKRESARSRLIPSITGAKRIWLETAESKLLD